MSLFRRLTVGMVGLLLLFSVGIFGIELQETRDAVTKRQQDQVANLAQALSLSLVSFVEIGDWTGAKTLMRAVSDGGVVNELRLDAVGLEQPVSVVAGNAPDAPYWFRQLIDIPKVAGERDVSSGWSPLGSIYIAADNSAAYDELWKLALQLLVWLAIGMVVVIALCVIVIRWLLKPLNTLSRRISNIQYEGFESINETVSVRELKGISAAVNHLGERLGQQFHAQAEQMVRLQRLAELDAVSQLGNRAYLTRALDEWLAAPIGGSLMILKIEYLNVLYRQEGFEARDQVIRALGDFIRAATLGGMPVQAARLSADEFAIVLPDADPSVRERWLEETLDAIDDIMNANPLAEERIRYSQAGIMVREPGMARLDLLSQADYALRQAIEQNIRWHLVVNDTLFAQRTRLEWRHVIEESLNNHQVEFVAQSVVLEDGSELHRELFVRLNENDQQHAASIFMPIINYFGLGASLDNYVLGWLSRHARTLDFRLAVNITENTVADEKCLSDLMDWLEKHPHIASRLDLELTEEVALNHTAAVHNLFRAGRKLGARGGVDRFARNLQDMEYLAKLHPDYVKIDQGFFVRDDIDNEFLHSLCMVAHQVEALVIVTRVESEEQRMRVASVGADGYQGFLAPAVSLEAA